jgi:hypothetical protein
MFVVYLLGTDFLVNSVSIVSVCESVGKNSYAFSSRFYKNVPAIKSNLKTQRVKFCVSENICRLQLQLLAFSLFSPLAQLLCAQRTVEFHEMQKNSR